VCMRICVYVFIYVCYVCLSLSLSISLFDCQFFFLFRDIAHPSKEGKNNSESNDSERFRPLRGVVGAVLKMDQT